MSEKISASSHDADPLHEADRPITETEQQLFTKLVGYWSGVSDRDREAATATSEFMRVKAPHRPVNEVVIRRTETSSSVRYEREGMAVTCRSTDDFVSLLVESRKPQDNTGLDELIRTEYVIDGPDRRAVQHEWLVDRQSGEPVGPRQTDDIETMLTFGDEYVADITVPEGDNDKEAFTLGRYQETEAIFAQLNQEGWVRSFAQ